MSPHSFASHPWSPNEKDYASIFYFFSFCLKHHSLVSKFSLRYAFFPSTGDGRATWPSAAAASAAHHFSGLHQAHSGWRLLWDQATTTSDSSSDATTNSTIPAARSASTSHAFGQRWPHHGQGDAPCTVWQRVSTPPSVHEGSSTGAKNGQGSSPQERQRYTILLNYRVRGKSHILEPFNSIIHYVPLLNGKWLCALFLKSSILYQSIFFYFIEIPEVQCFIKKRGWFNSQFCRLKVQARVIPLILPQVIAPVAVFYGKSACKRERLQGETGSQRWTSSQACSFYQPLRSMNSEPHENFLNPIWGCAPSDLNWAPPLQDPSLTSPHWALSFYNRKLGDGGKPHPNYSKI